MGVLGILFEALKQVNVEQIEDVEREEKRLRQGPGVRERVTKLKQQPKWESVVEAEREWDRLPSLNATVMSSVVCSWQLEGFGDLDQSSVRSR